MSSSAMGLGFETKHKLINSNHSVSSFLIDIGVLSLRGVYVVAIMESFVASGEETGEAGLTKFGAESETAGW
jgi:hypothetical protein